ncbi:MAG: urease accessory protein UreE [Betaproteobacteria bacterium]|nr:urease accessory protein UreE [Betaproteobacteria bacterium]
MIKASFISPKGAWQVKPADTIILDYEGRYRRRIAMTGVRGIEFMLDLPDAVILQNGDALVLDDGRLIEIVAAPEELAEIRCRDPLELARIAWHLGNRHITAQIMPNRIRIRRDHVIEDMARTQGGKVAHIEAPFEPDRGAYDEPVSKKSHDRGHHNHDHHGHDHHGHDHHGHDHHNHGPAHGEPGHIHDEHCDHDHHDHKHHAHPPAHGEAGHVHDEHCDHDHEHDHHGHDNKHHNHK